MCKQSLRITPSRGPYVTKHIGHSIGSEFGMTSQFSSDISSSYRAILTSSDTSVSTGSPYCCQGYQNVYVICIVFFSQLYITWYRETNERRSCVCSVVQNKKFEMLCTWCSSFVTSSVSTVSWFSSIICKSSVDGACGSSRTLACADDCLFVSGLSICNST